jgi:hypothetical protein
MAKTVTAAFNEFLKDSVNLDPVETNEARASRDWLVSQIHSFPDKDSIFPILYSDRDEFFGSFARRTKKRELDDIDMMIALSADGGYYHQLLDRIEIHIPNSISNLKMYCHDNTDILNSRKVINKFVSLLKLVSQYNKADIKPNMEAATLNLKSYHWNFDVVPCFFTQKDWFGRDYYLIPDGYGNWKKTDPRIDKDRVTKINQFHDGNVLNMIRLIKYWNKRPTMPSMSSYLIENMILNFYSEMTYSKASNYIDLDIAKVLEYLSKQVYYVVDDPKDIQGNINNLSSYERERISKRAYTDSQKALEAREFEKQNNHSLSISKWGEIFGSKFPTYS